MPHFKKLSYNKNKGCGEKPALMFQVHLNPKYFFRLYKIYLWTCSKRISFLLTKSLLFISCETYTLSVTRASERRGYIPDLRSETDFLACLQRRIATQILVLRQVTNIPMPLTSPVVRQIMLSFLQVLIP